MGYEKLKSGYNQAISVQELKAYAEKYGQIPIDRNAPFVVHSTIEGGSKFIIIWSSQKLINDQKQWPILHVDATYKILSYGFPVIVGLTI
jgi:hypothetical protein